MRRSTRRQGIAPDPKTLERLDRAMRRRSRSHSLQGRSSASANGKKESPGSSKKERREISQSGNEGLSLVVDAPESVGPQEDNNVDVAPNGTSSVVDQKDGIGGDGGVVNPGWDSVSEIRERKSINCEHAYRRALVARRKRKPDNGESNRGGLRKAESLEDLQSPVREIIFTREPNTMQNSLSHRSKRARTAPSDLDEPTLQAVKEYLSSQELCNALQDDELTHFMTRLNQIASRQVDYQHHLLGDSDDSETSFFMEILADEENYALAHELFKSMIRKIRNNHTDLSLDLKTINWLKKAAGLHRAKTETAAREHAMKTDPSRMMKTRTATRRSREQKRGGDLRILAEAVDEIEKDLGPFVPQMFAVHEPAADHQEPAVRQPTAAVKTRKEQRHKLVARIGVRLLLKSGSVVDSLRTVILSRIVAGGKNMNGYAASSRFKRNVVNGAQRRLEPLNLEKYTSSLSYWDWQRRLATSLYGDRDNPHLSDISYRRKVNKSRSPTLRREGCVCRLPMWDTVNKSLTDFQESPVPLQSKDAHAKMCLLLINSLSGAARSWAISEFFYSDVDGTWYNQILFSEVAATIGVRPDARLTRSEWKAVRRRFPSKPRRFSRKFIASELTKRNDHRSRVRMLQNDPMQVGAFKSRYAIPAVIPAGAKVTAYSRRFRIIQRGCVLSYDSFNSTYLILFDSAKFGSEYCADCDVATHGGPEILVQATACHTWDSETRRASALPSGSKRGALHDKKARRSIILRHKVENALRLTPTTYQFQENPKTVRDKVAERDMFSMLVRVSESATKRKELILQRMEEICARRSEYLTFEEIESNRVAEASNLLREHHAWLRANLDETNEILEKTMFYIRVLYGKLYLPPQSEELSVTSSVVRSVLRSVVAERRPVPNAALDWSASLTSQAATLSDCLATILRPPVAAGEVSVPDVEKGRLASAGAIILAASCCQAMSAAAPSVVDHHEPSLAALIPSAHDLLIGPDLPRVAHGDDLYHTVAQVLDQATEELHEALDLFATEVVVASTRYELQKQVT